MSRSTWKLQYINQSQFRNNFKKLLLDSSKQDKNSKISIKIWNRESVITKFFLGKLVQIYNGKIFVYRRIRSIKMVGGKFGELSRCTKRARRNLTLDKKKTGRKTLKFNKFLNTKKNKKQNYKNKTKNLKKIKFK